jgi:2-dehydro-3-deoxyglucarate aldolase/4-hydroxy-2-oxoheptanedioate aldolase
LAIGTQAGELGAAGGFGRRLRALEPMVGTVITVPSVGLAELTATAVDFVWIDLEHGALGIGDVQPLAVGARSARAAALVRLPDAGAAAASAILDAGVEGVVAPRVETAPDAARLVEQLRDPPRGSRGVAARRGRDYGRERSPMAPAADLAFMVQIESPRAVDRAGEIAAIDGVDALVVGCADLSHALGEGGRLPTAALVDAVEEVQRAAAAAGIASGVAGPGDAALLAELAGGRSTVFVLSADVRIYARALDSAVAGLRRELASHAPDPVNANVGA